MMYSHPPADCWGMFGASHYKQITDDWLNIFIFYEIIMILLPPYTIYKDSLFPVKLFTI